MSYWLLSSDTREKFRERERDKLEGVQRASYHAFEMLFWHRELHQSLEKSMGALTQIQSEAKMEAEITERTQQLRNTAFELLHHTILLGDELGVCDQKWPEAPIDRGAWHRKLRLMMAHVTCGDECPSSKVYECLGAMVYLARHTCTMGGETSLRALIKDRLS